MATSNSLSNKSNDSMVIPGPEAEKGVAENQTKVSKIRAKSDSAIENNKITDDSLSKVEKFRSHNSPGEAASVFEPDVAHGVFDKDETKFTDVDIKAESSSRGNNIIKSEKRLVASDSQTRKDGYMLGEKGPPAYYGNSEFNGDSFKGKNSKDPASTVSRSNSKFNTLKKRLLSYFDSSGSGNENSNGDGNGKGKISKLPEVNTSISNGKRSSTKTTVQNDPYKDTILGAPFTDRLERDYFEEQKIRGSAPIEGVTNGASIRYTQSFIPNALAATFRGYAFVTWYCSNSKHSSSYFKNTYGFEEIAYSGLETGSRNLTHRVVRNGNVVIRFTSAVRSPPYDPEAYFKDKEEKDEKPDGREKHVPDHSEICEVLDFVLRHGDGIKDIAFIVDDAKGIHEFCLNNKLLSIKDPTLEKDADGSVIIATVLVLDDVTHTFIQNINYKGKFLPHYASRTQLPSQFDSSNAPYPKIELMRIDHCVQNQGWNKLDESCSFYQKLFGFKEFWSVDEKDISTEYSALRSRVMVSENGEILMPINEPAPGVSKSQVEEFIEYYNGPGIQHIAISTKDLISTVKLLRERGAQFIDVNPSYYEGLRKRLAASNVVIKENINDIEKMGILVDFDDNGYLLQLFTSPLTDRPTFFLEFIQRENHNGFGAGNFKALFESIEGEQNRRGNLVPSGYTH